MTACTKNLMAENTPTPIRINPLDTEEEMSIDLDSPRKPLVVDGELVTEGDYMFDGYQKALHRALILAGEEIRRLRVELDG